MRRAIVGCGSVLLAAGVSAQAPPAYVVDPLWPKPLPNHWILGSVTGVDVDRSNRTWVAHRGAASMTARTENGLDQKPLGAEYCCASAPPILAFDANGTLVQRWGGPGTGYEWPQNPGAIAVDSTGHVWITAQGAPAPTGRGGRAAATPPPPEDAHVLKFTADGKFVLQIGKAGQPGAADSQTTLRRPAAIAVNTAGTEVFVGDTGNRRIVVFDAQTGTYKRHWGAYGSAPDATATIPAYTPGEAAPKQFRNITCVAVSTGGEVYVCDRESNRIQVFQADGKFVREVVVSASTRGTGSVWDIAFSNDAAQRQVFVADGHEHTVHVLRRDTLAEVGRIGTGGRLPGHFYAVGSVAVDSRGAVITGETLEGKRVQKFAAR